MVLGLLIYVAILLIYSETTQIATLLRIRNVNYSLRFAMAGSIAHGVARSSRRIGYFLCISRTNKIQELSNKALKALLGLNSNNCPQFEAQNRHLSFLLFRAIL